MSPLTSACITGDLKLIEIALQHKYPPDASTLDAAVRTGNPSIVMRICGIGARPSSQTLTLACETGNEQIVNLAIVTGAQPSSDTLKVAAAKTLNPAIFNKVQQVAQCLVPGGSAESSNSSLQASAVSTQNINEAATTLSTNMQRKSELEKQINSLVEKERQIRKQIGAGSSDQEYRTLKKQLDTLGPQIGALQRELGSLINMAL